MQKSIKVRGFELTRILEKPHGVTELILGYIELERELETAKEACSRLKQDRDLETTIEIEEFANDDGFLADPKIPESVWIDSIKSKTQLLDVRAILSELPQELGLYNLKIAYKERNQILTGFLKVWVVPAK